MEFMKPQLGWMHSFWGTSPARELATGFKAALDQLGRSQRQMTQAMAGGLKNHEKRHERIEQFRDMPLKKSEHRGLTTIMDNNIFY